MSNGICETQALLQKTIYTRALLTTYCLGMIQKSSNLSAYVGEWLNWSRLFANYVKKRPQGMPTFLLLQHLLLSTKRPWQRLRRGLL